MKMFLKKRKGFTLVETICASIVLCGTAMTVGAMSTRFLNEMRLNRQYEVAMSLADRQLNLISYTGVENLLNSENNKGVFENFEPQYNWEVTTRYQEIDNLYRVKVTISWVERNRPYSLSVETMIN